MIAWITGGGTGIGRALAETLLKDGAKVVISGRRKDVLDEAARSLSTTTTTGEIIAVSGDAADPAHVDAVLKATLKWGQIDLLINNAGSNYNRGFGSASTAEYVEAFHNNCLSAIRCTQAVLPGMLAARRGSIVTISSIYGRWASATSASYSVSKYALAGYTDMLQQGLSGSGVHVLGVFPGFIRTGMTLPFVKRGSLRSYMGKNPEDLAAAILAAVHSKRRDLYYPWYVSWVIRLHRWMPGLMDSGSARVKR